MVFKMPPPAGMELCRAYLSEWWYQVKRLASSNSNRLCVAVCHSTSPATWLTTVVAPSRNHKQPTSDQTHSRASGHGWNEGRSSRQVLALTPTRNQSGRHWWVATGPSTDCATDRQSIRPRASKSSVTAVSDSTRTLARRLTKSSQSDGL